MEGREQSYMYNYMLLLIIASPTMASWTICAAIIRTLIWTSTEHSKFYVVKLVNNNAVIYFRKCLSEFPLNCNVQYESVVRGSTVVT